MLRNDLAIGSIVYFHPERRNDYCAFVRRSAFTDKPFKVIVTVLEGEYVGVKRLENYTGIEQIVKVEQLSYTGEYTQDEHSDEIGINVLIARLEWLAVEQKVIDKETLLKIYGAIVNGN